MAGFEETEGIDANSRSSCLAASLWVASQLKASSTGPPAMTSNYCLFFGTKTHRHLEQLKQLTYMLAHLSKVQNSMPWLLACVSFCHDSANAELKLLDNPCKCILKDDYYTAGYGVVVIQMWLLVSQLFLFPKTFASHNKECPFSTHELWSLVCSGVAVGV